MIQDDKTMRIGIDLDGDLKEQFLAIKKDKGMENNTDVVRNLIAEAYKNLANKKGA